MARRRNVAPRSSPAPSRTRSPRSDAREDAKVTVFLLMELRRANRTIQRLRKVALAVRDGDPERMRAALAQLRTIDLHPERCT